MIIVGIDWARSNHQVHVLDSDGRTLETRSVGHEARDLTALAQSLSSHEPDPSQIQVAIEMHDGALLAWLLDQQYTVYGINPKASQRARDRYRPGGGKSDRLDAFVLADMLRTDRGMLRPVGPQSQTTRKLRRLLELRDQRVSERTATILRLRDRLAQWCPQLSTLCDDLTCDWQRDLLQRFPIQQDLHNAHGNTVRSFLRRHQMGQRNIQRLHDVRQATPLPIPDAELPTLRLDLSFLLEQLQMLCQTIKELDKHIAHAVEQHPDAQIFRSLPVKADNTVARLLAGFGDNRGRTLDHRELAAMWAVAPITIQSGKYRHVQRRFAANHRMGQALIYFAFHTSQVTGCWAAEYYQRKKNAGKRHYTILRSIAQRWVKILTRLWRDRTLYDEQLHQNRRQQQAAA